MSKSSNTPVPAPEAKQAENSPAAPGRSGLKVAAALIVVGAVAAGIYFKRSKGSPEPGAAETTTAVAVAKVSRQNLAQDLVFDAEFRPYQEVDLHAKVAGYLNDMHVDIGDHVQQGQVIASLEIPELQDDLEHANAVKLRSEQEVKRAEAAYHQAHLVYTRLLAVDKSQAHLIAQQDIDAAQSQDAAAEAALSAARLSVKEAEVNVRKLETTVKYSQIAAPFAGVITKRYADPGALIQAGINSSTQSQPLVRLSQLDKLRLIFPISSSYVSKIHTGDAVEVRVQSHDRTLKAKVSRLTDEVDMATRTMDAEVDLDNKDITLLPGMYASVVLHPEHRDNVLAVPIEAVSQKGNPSVYLINSKNEVEQRPVTLGLETATRAEIVGGLNENDLVVVGGHGVKAGQKVEPKVVELGSL